jgi:lysophospholipase L1-like esterase
MRLRTAATLALSGLLLATGMQVLAHSSATAAARPAAGNGQGWCQSKTSVGVIGDSISSGWELQGTASDNVNDPNIWANQFAAIFGATVDNVSIAGTSTANYISGGSLAAKTQQIAADGNNADFVFLGTNDWFLSVTPATYTANLESIYSTIRAGSPNAAIVFISQYDLTNDPNKPKGTPAYTWAQYVGAATNAAVATGAGLIMSNQVVQAEGTGSGFTSASWLYLSDDTHLTIAGQRVLSAYVLGRMVALC